MKENSSYSIGGLNSAALGPVDENVKSLQRRTYGRTTGDRSMNYTHYLTMNWIKNILSKTNFLDNNLWEIWNFTFWSMCSIKVFESRESNNWGL